MDTLATLVRELEPEFPAVPTAELRRHCRHAARDLRGSVPALALPEMLSRLVRLRLTAEVASQAEQHRLDGAMAR